ncbi:hypothetical protein [Lysobacter capsici]|uniref:hypothetical protein n=1 Tax=Lysobacter capsici TaxID=435897 RepID=UPI00287B7719|nr:hypothetical protein [Lysobacter capsici]WND79405.1 hypothetical protein RJ610_19190 [Lysobacter capsici]WND84601.1 hypothetical protein RJ609_19205 [Lysobacter capsici]
MKKETYEIIGRCVVVAVTYGLLLLVDAPTWAAFIGALIYAQLALPTGFSDRGES